MNKKLKKQLKITFVIVSVLGTSLGIIKNTDSIFAEDIRKTLNAQNAHENIKSPKMHSGYHNPLIDFLFTADPTAVEYNGRLYVYGTNDHQQFESVGPDAKENTYEKIRSIAIISTDDMVNWTYHGVINVGEISPWCMNSWAPSIEKRIEKDGKTHFYLYYSDGGRGVGVLTATSPTGPWTDPLGKDLVNQSTPGLGRCEAPFDPGVVIDKEGTGWLSFGGGSPETEFQPGNSRIVRLGKDMISLDSEIIKIDAPYFFEASELNYINDTWVYTYNTSWTKKEKWPFKSERPTTCSMCYMTSKSPLERESWTFQHNYLKNPGDYGYKWGNNHTHLQKYRGKWYIIYHNAWLEESFGSKAGFRNICIDEIDVNEKNVHISMGFMSKKGVKQLQTLNPFKMQQAETIAATEGIKFVKDKRFNSLAATPQKENGILCIRKADFTAKAKKIQVWTSGIGEIEVRLNAPDGDKIAHIEINKDNYHKTTCQLLSTVHDITDVYFIIKGKSLHFDQWNFQ